MDTNERMRVNLLLLKANSYPGSGIIAGMDETGEYLIQVYWIMGRSENSSNCILVCHDNSMVKTAPVDFKRIKDPSLINYTAMNQNLHNFSVSNGNQTDDALNTADDHTSFKSLGRALRIWEYGPDDPNYTPRITSVFSLGTIAPFSAEMSVLKQSSFSNMCNKYLFELDLAPGLGYCITTYSRDGDPLPSFEGEPYLLPLSGDIECIAQTIWDTLNEDNRVSLAVKFINKKTKETSVKIINKYEVIKND